MDKFTARRRGILIIIIRRRNGAKTISLQISFGDLINAFFLLKMSVTSGRLNTPDKPASVKFDHKLSRWNYHILIKHVHFRKTIIYF